MEQHVFVSYKHEDRSFVEMLFHQLQTAGFDVWIDEERLRAGENWREAINFAIRESFALIIIISPEAKTSEYVTYEWAYAQGAGVKVVPIMLRESTLHPQLEMLQFLDFTDPAKPPWDKLMRRLWEIQGEYQPHAISIPLNAPPAVKSAVALLDSHDPNERRTALRSLAQMNYPEAYSALVAAVQHPMRDVRVDAAFMLSKQTNHKEAAAVPGLLDALDDDDKRIRVAACNALGEIGDPVAVPVLLEILGHEKDNDIRWAATGALGMIGQDAVPGLLEALRDDNWKVRRSAADALWTMREPLAADGLIDALMDRNDVVRQAAANALEALGQSAVRALVHTLGSSSTHIQKVASDMLYRIGTPEALEAIEKWNQQHK